MLGSPGKGRPRSANQCLPALHKIPDLVQRFPFHHITHQQMPSVTSLSLLTLVHKNLSPCTALQSSFLSARLDAAIIHESLNKSLLDQHIVCGNFSFNNTTY